MTGHRRERDHRVPHRPAPEVGPDRVQAERLQRADEPRAGGSGVLEEHREPREEPDRGGRVGHDERAPRRRSGPERPQELRDEHEHDRVMRVQRRARADRVGDPPATPLRFKRPQQRQRRQQREEQHQRVGARLGRVEDEERAERHHGGPDQRRRAADRAQAEHIGERDGGDPGDQRRQPQRLGRLAEPGRDPRQHVIQRRRQLLIAAHDVERASEAVPGHGVVRRQLVAEQRVPERAQTQQQGDERDRPDEQRGRRRSGPGPGHPYGCPFATISMRSPSGSSR